MQDADTCGPNWSCSHNASGCEQLATIAPGKVAGTDIYLETCRGSAGSGHEGSDKSPYPGRLGLGAGEEAMLRRARLRYVPRLLFAAPQLRALLEESETTEGSWLSTLRNDLQLLSSRTLGHHSFATVDHDDFSCVSGGQCSVIDLKKVGQKASMELMPLINQVYLGCTGCGSVARESNVKTEGDSFCVDNHCWRFHQSQHWNVVSVQSCLHTLRRCRRITSVSTRRGTHSEAYAESFARTA